MKKLGREKEKEKERIKDPFGIYHAGKNYTPVYFKPQNQNEFNPYNFPRKEI